MILSGANDIQSRECKHKYTFKWIKVYVNIPWNGYQSNFLQIIITYIDQIVQTISLHL